MTEFIIPLIGVVALVYILLRIVKELGFAQPYSEFVEWCKKEVDFDKKPLSFSQYNRGHPINERISSIFTGTTNEEGPDIVVNQSIEPGDYLINGEEKINAMDTIVRRLHFTAEAGTTFTINSLKIKELIIPDYINTSFIFNNCWIAKLKFMESNNEANVKFELNNTCIGLLDMHSSAIKNFKVCGGAVLDINCPPPESTNPFCGSVSFDRHVFFPKDTRNYPLDGPQPYRNMRHHLRSLENETHASVFHKLEMTIERETDPPLNKILSYCYGLFSGYGSSIIKPLSWLILAFLLCFGTIYHQDGAIINGNIHHESNKLSGWQSALEITDNSGRMLKAGVFSGQYVLYPLSLVTGKSLLIPRTTNLLYMTLALSFFSTIFLFLLILAIRRRFKMS